mmetsp:Transcript_8830/g.19444  ORF Transcript_8830/g.19444 Transcript_8830/m.19444 type:complete len:243 (-) Transcript_8830:463-1191(-)
MSSKKATAAEPSDEPLTSPQISESFRTNTMSPTIYEMMITLPSPNIAAISAPDKDTLSQNYYAKSAPEALHTPPSPIQSKSGINPPLHFTSFLPYPLPWAPVASPAIPPPDFSWFTESCGVKSAIGVVMGSGMGMVMGVFLSAMSDTRPPVTIVNGREVPTSPMKEQMKQSMRSTREKSLYWARNFAFISGLFAGTECIVEKARGKHDVWNQVLGGCATGAAMQAKSGPQGKSLLQVRFIGM